MSQRGRKADYGEFYEFLRSGSDYKNRYALVVP